MQRFLKKVPNWVHSNQSCQHSNNAKIFFSTLMLLYIIPVARVARTPKALYRSDEISWQWIEQKHHPRRTLGACSRITNKCDTSAVTFPISKEC